MWPRKCLLWLFSHSLPKSCSGYLQVSRGQCTVQSSFGDARRALTRAGPLTTEHRSPPYKTPLSLAQHSPVPYSSAHLWSHRTNNWQAWCFTSDLPSPLNSPQVHFKLDENLTHRVRQYRKRRKTQQSRLRNWRSQSYSPSEHDYHPTFSSSKGHNYTRPLCCDGPAILSPSCSTGLTLAQAQHTPSHTGYWLPARPRQACRKDHTWLSAAATQTPCVPCDPIFFSTTQTGQKHRMLVGLVVAVAWSQPPSFWHSQTTLNTLPGTACGLLT